MESQQQGSGEVGGQRIMSAKAYRAAHPLPVTRMHGPDTRRSGVYVPIELLESEETDFNELERLRRIAARDPDRGPGVYIPHHMMRSPAAREGGAVQLARELGIRAAPVRRAEYAGAGVPGAAVTDELKDHNYDGIQEYDNPIPGWWHMIWWGSIVFSVFYVLIYHSPLVPTLSERHAGAEERALEVRFSELRGIPMGEAKVLQIMGQESWLAQGESLFKQQCALCHGQNGEGLVGPNMTDEYFKNTTTLAGVISVIQDGAANGAMPAQRNLMNENEIALVAAYAASLRGKELDGPREAEGEIIAPWPTLDEEGNVVPAEAP